MCVGGEVDRIFKRALSLAPLHLGAAIVAAAAWIALAWPACGPFDLSARAEPAVENQVDTADESSPGNQADKDARQRDREKMLQAMRAKAQTLKVRDSADDTGDALPMLSEPLFRYSDQPRRILDASLWAWGRKGRPEVMAKVEGYDRPQGTQWLFCVVSLSSATVTVDPADGGHVWSSTEPGMELQTLDDGPEPAASKAGRLRQMKEVARRFSATITVDPNEQNVQEMRFLPQPIHRYGDDQPGGMSGALFGFTTNGTNPDALLAIELARQEESAFAWRYALAGMTQGGLSVKLDEKEVWTKAYQPGPTEYGNWLWYFEGKRPPKPR
jgi:hypothetical protein